MHTQYKQTDTTPHVGITIVLMVVALAASCNSDDIVDSDSPNQQEMGINVQYVDDNQIEGGCTSSNCQDHSHTVTECDLIKNADHVILAKINNLSVNPNSECSPPFQTCHRTPYMILRGHPT